MSRICVKPLIWDAPMDGSYFIANDGMYVIYQGPEDHLWKLYTFGRGLPIAFKTERGAKEKAQKHFDKIVRSYASAGDA